MIRKILLLVTLVVTVVFGLRAQSTGTLTGQVTDDATGEEIFNAAVTLKQNGEIKYGTATGFDGAYDIKLIPPGNYDVEVYNLGYKQISMQNLRITAGKINIENFKMKQDVEMLGEVEVVDYKIKLIDPDQTSSGNSVGAKELSKMAGRDAASVATTVAGVYTEDGSVGSIRGSRENATVYYVDGVKVRGTSSIPKSATEQVSVITGGLPAQYGDVTGGIISLTTKGPSNEFFGGVELETSQFLDPFGHNLASLTLSGPIITQNKEGQGKRTIMGFLVSAEGSMEADRTHSTMGIWRAKDDVIEQIKQNPTRYENGTIYNNVEFLGQDAFTKNKSIKNYNYKDLNIVGKIDISPVRDLNITFGGTIDMFNRKIPVSQMFDYDKISENKYNNWRVYGRLSQRFRSAENDEKSIIKNPNYQIQVDYSRVTDKTFNPDFTDNFFRYGHMGYYDVITGKQYERKDDDITGLNGYVMENFTYSLDPSSYRPSEYNPLLSRYVEQYYEYFPNAWLDYNAPGANYYLNGQFPSNSYGGIVGATPGFPSTSYSFSDASQFRVIASGSFDLKKHEISLGFEYEQRKDAFYALGASGLWTLARQLTNLHIMEKDSLPRVIYSGATFRDTIEYDRLYNASAQSSFDLNLRNHLGLPINGTDWINVDNLNPDELKLSWFSPDELFNQGSPYVSYSGYDYTGKKLSYKPTLEDFFLKTDPETGRKTRPISAFEPNYIAGYIQDKFAFKDLIFNIGIRVDRYDANQLVLKDMYSLYDIYTVNDLRTAVKNGETNVSDNIKEWLNKNDNSNINDAVLYVNNKLSPTEVKGYRIGDVWYNSEGSQQENPETIKGTNGITPYMKDATLSDPDINAFQDYKPQINVLPRIAFSFPISEDALFFAHYDILSRRPAGGNTLNPVQYLYMQKMNTDVLANPDLKSERTTDYELGFQQKLSSSSSLKLSAFYREMRDMQQTIAVKGGFPTDYYTYGNIDFGTVKGLSVTFDLRRTGNVTLRASYTLQFANGTGSDSGSQEAIVKSDKPNLKTTLPLNYDQRHAFQVSFDYRYGGKVTGEAYSGPKINGKNILANTGVNFTVNAGSGSPYTIKNKPAGGVIIGSMNGARKPWRATINMRLDRDFRINLMNSKKDEVETRNKKEKYGYLNVYLEITNLLNTKNVLNVYDYTGSPSDNGYLDFDEYKQELAVKTNEESYRNYYIMSYRYNDNNYSNPRTIRLGVSFNF